MKLLCKQINYSFLIRAKRKRMQVRISSVIELNYIKYETWNCKMYVFSRVEQIKQ